MGGWSTPVGDAGERGRRGRRPVVFVVEDDVATLSLLCEVALQSGWEARGFSRLQELRRAIEEEPPSLLILDDDLPDGRGGDLARELRTHRRLAGVPLLVCTGAHPMRRAEIGDWAPVIAKPFDLAAIERFLVSAHPMSRKRSRDDRAG
jgi:DNA-binding response OmpR family regulator